MGGKSTLQKKSVSSDVTVNTDVYDLKSWQGLTSLLKAGKDALEPSAYGEFRNLVLQYAQHGGDAEFKQRIDAVVASFGKEKKVPDEPASVEESTVEISVATHVGKVSDTVVDEAPKEAHVLPSRRIQPRFVPPIREVTEESETVPPRSRSVPESKTVTLPVPPVVQESPLASPPEIVVPEIVPEEPEKEILPEETHSPVPEPVPSVPVVEDTPAPRAVPEPVPQSVVDVPVSPAPTAPAPIPEVVTVPQQSPRPISESTFAPPQITFASIEQCKVRISEIKRMVNAHIGNPVALMALPNNIGKTYMAALLTALKMTGSGAPGDIDLAMAELERAYNALLQGNSHTHSADAEPVPPVPPVVQESPLASPPEIVVPEIVPEEPEKEVLPEETHSPVPEPVPSVPVVEDTPAPRAVPEPVQQSVVDVPVSPAPTAPAPESHAVTVPVQVSTAPHHASTPADPAKAARVLEELRATMNALEKTDVHEKKEELSSDRIYSTQETVAPTAEPVVPTRADEMHSAFEQTDQTISAVVHTLQGDLPQASPSIVDIIAGDASGYDRWNETGGTDMVQKGDDTNSDAQKLIHRENKHSKKGVAEVTPVAVLEAQGISATEAIVRQSELSSPQITTMLNKLLHEWSIFSGSGFFGTGPGGAEHPLYITLAPMGMGEVVSGRWNNADPKVLKVIKQYVDAWRHEQGITFTPTETFDHYLRRVVQRILKRQNL